MSLVNKHQNELKRYLVSNCWALVVLDSGVIVATPITSLWIKKIYKFNMIWTYFLVEHL